MRQDRDLREAFDRIHPDPCALTGQSSTSTGRVAADPGLAWWSGLVSGGAGLGGLGDGDVEAEGLDWIWRMWLRS